MHLLSYALRFLKHYFRPRVYLQLPARARYSFGTLLVRFIAHGIEEKMALLPNLFYIKGDGLDQRGSAAGIVNSSNFRCQTMKRYGKISLSRFPSCAVSGVDPTVRPTAPVHELPRARVQRHEVTLIYLS